MMRIISKLAAAAALGAMLATGGCVTDPETGQRHMSDTAIGGIGGALSGYLLGDLVGGRHDRSARIIGAGLGGIAGAGIGAYMDQQERDLRQQTAGTDVQVIRQGDNLVLNMPSNVTFAYDSAQVQPQFQATLDQVASVLKHYDETYIDVYGFTDSTGSESYNQQLSERRAESVASYLEARGVLSARLGTQGYGETHPIAPNDTPEGRAANRRVEIRLVPIPASDVRR